MHKNNDGGGSTQGAGTWSDVHRNLGQGRLHRSIGTGPAGPIATGPIFRQKTRYMYVQHSNIHINFQFVFVDVCNVGGRGTRTVAARMIET